MECSSMLTSAFDQKCLERSSEYESWTLWKCRSMVLEQTGFSSLQQVPCKHFLNLTDLILKLSSVWLHHYESEDVSRNSLLLVILCKFFNTFYLPEQLKYYSPWNTACSGFYCCVHRQGCNPTTWSIWLSSVKVAVVQIPSFWKKKKKKDEFKILETKDWAHGVITKRDAENT